MRHDAGWISSISLHPFASCVEMDHRNRCQGMEAPSFEQRKCTYCCMCKCSQSLLLFFFLSFNSSFIQFKGILVFAICKRWDGKLTSSKRKQRTNKGTFRYFSYFIQVLQANVFSFQCDALVVSSPEWTEEITNIRIWYNSNGTHNVNILWFNAVGICAKSSQLI